jgi:four helix bundle protein
VWDEEKEDENEEDENIEVNEVREVNEEGMEKTKTFEELTVWKMSHEFTLLMYKFTEPFPKSEIFGLTSQFRRAAVSISANIAEGYKKKSTADKLRYYNISQGSLEECRYYIILSFDLGYLTNETNILLKDKIEETSKLLNAYYRAIAQNS